MELISGVEGGILGVKMPPLVFFFWVPNPYPLTGLVLLAKLEMLSGLPTIR